MNIVYPGREKNANGIPFTTEEAGSLLARAKHRYQVVIIAFYELCVVGSWSPLLVGVCGNGNVYVTELCPTEMLCDPFSRLIWWFGAAINATCCK